jgi:hypothetical protein
MAFSKWPAGRKMRSVRSTKDPELEIPDPGTVPGSGRLVVRAVLHDS